MPGYTKDAGTWRKIVPQTKVAGSWVRPQEGYVKDADTWKQWWLDGGVNDRTFNTADVLAGFDNTVNHVSIQSDGKIVCGGSFNYYRGTSQPKIARLNLDGTLDTGFTANIGTGFGGTVNVLDLQTDGKILVGGLFTSFNGITCNRIARLNSDGTLDTGFNIGTGFNSEVKAVTVQPNGKILVGGLFTSYTGVSCTRIARLNSDGTLDTGFPTNTGFPSQVNKIIVQPDGQILVGGTFSTYKSVSASRIIRLNDDSTRDTSFDMGTGFNAGVIDIALQSDGKIVVGGLFTTYNGANSAEIARLNSDGSLDTGFAIGTGFNDNVHSVAIQPDGKILVGGEFLTYNGVTAQRFARLNTDGSIDTTTNFVAGNVYDIAIQSDGKIVCGGSFVNTLTPSQGVARLNSDGGFDGEFSTTTGFSDRVRAITVQPNGKILVGGLFTSYNGVSCNRIARLNLDGTMDTSFTIGTGFNGDVNDIAIQSDGKIVVVGTFTTYNDDSSNGIVRLNSDGTRDTGFSIGTGFAGNLSPAVNRVVIQPDGKIVCGGNLLSYNGVSRTRLARLNSDGTLDTGFISGVTFNSVVSAIVILPNGQIYCAGSSTKRIVRLNTNGTEDSTFVEASTNGNIRDIAIQSDGKIVVVGQFTSYDGLSYNNIARLNSDGTLDLEFDIGNGIGPSGSGSFGNTVAIQPDGKILAGGEFTRYKSVTNRNMLVRINTDGSLDLTFAPQLFNKTVYKLALQSDGKALVGGDFYYNSAVVRNRIARLGGE
jgi:uncharacterized delta-60 repeat protein